MNDLQQLRKNLRAMGARFSVAESACGCSKCRGMCIGKSGMPSPQEAAEIERSHPGSLVEDMSCTANGKPFKTLVPRMTPTGCVFLQDGRCILHATMKPIECRLASHELTTIREATQLRMSAAMLWNQQ